MLVYILAHKVAFTAWTLVALGGVNGALQYKFPKSHAARGVSFLFHFLLDVFMPTVRSDSTGAVSTFAVPILDGLLTREGQGTFKIPVLQRSAPPRRHLEPPRLVYPRREEPPEDDPPRKVA